MRLYSSNKSHVEPLQDTSGSCADYYPKSSHSFEARALGSGESPVIVAMGSRAILGHRNR